MSLIGPRPQLVRDMVFMTNEQRKRHTAKPGLSGLAQINGRNSISWEDKMNWDIEYIEKCGFFEDIRIIFLTVKKAFIKQEGITQDDMATAEDYGDYLLRTEKISRKEYDNKQEMAKKILNNNINKNDELRIEAVRKSAEVMAFSMRGHTPIYHLDELFYLTLQDIMNGVYDENKVDMTLFKQMEGGGILYDQTN